MSLFQYFVSHLLEAMAYFLYAVALLFYFLKVKKDTRFKILGVYFLIGFLLLLRILATRGGNNLYYSMLYVVNSIGWGAYFFLVFESKVKKNIVIGVVLLTIFHFAYRNFILTHQNIFDSSGYVISSSGIILLIFIFFHQLLSHVKAESLSLNFDFWIVSSQLIYHLGAFAIFLTYNHFTIKILDEYTLENRDILTSLWGVHNSLLFLSSLIVLIGVIWISQKKERR